MVRVNVTSRIMPGCASGLASVLFSGCSSARPVRPWSEGGGPTPIPRLSTPPPALYTGPPAAAYCPLYPDASCPVTIDSPPLLPGIHEGEGTAILWDSNPPSSGAHYPIWAAFQEYTTPVPRGYYVHDLEHGAVVL